MPRNRLARVQSPANSPPLNNRTEGASKKTCVIWEPSCPRAAVSGGVSASQAVLYSVASTRRHCAVGPGPGNATRDFPQECSAIINRDGVGPKPPPRGVAPSSEQLHAAVSNDPIPTRVEAGEKTYLEERRHHALGVGQKRITRHGPAVAAAPVPTKRKIPIRRIEASRNRRFPKS